MWKCIIINYDFMSMCTLHRLMEVLLFSPGFFSVCLDCITRMAQSENGSSKGRYIQQPNINMVVRIDTVDRITDSRP